LVKIDVHKDGESIYFPVDNGELIGINVAECSDMKIYLSENRVQRILFLKKPAATLYPLEDESKVNSKLSGFEWFEKHRPRNKNDIFRWID
jgi:hypothetical protein